VVAPHDGEQPPRVGKFSLFNVLNPRAIDADRHFVFAFARHGAGMAADALAVVDQEAKRGHRRGYL
jgi:hypothetical protein